LEWDVTESRDYGKERRGLHRPSDCWGRRGRSPVWSAGLLLGRKAEAVGSSLASGSLGRPPSPQQLGASSLHPAATSTNIFQGPFFWTECFSSRRSWEWTGSDICEAI